MKFKQLHRWIRKIKGPDLSPTGRSHSEEALLRYFIAESVVAITLMLSLLFISLMVHASIMIEYATSLLAIVGALSFVAFILFRKIEHCILFQQLLTITVVAFYTARMGGLLTSGGIIILGAAPVLKTLVFKQLRKMVTVYIFFLCCLTLLALLDPDLSGKNLLSPSQNKFFFALNFAVIISYIFLFAAYTQRMFSKLEHKEVLRQKEINDAKTRLYTNITHEFRTPLTVILGLADSLKNNEQAELRGKAKTITRNGERLLELVDQLLNLSKVESGNMGVKNVYGDVIPFLRYIFQLQKYHADEKNLQFVFESASQSYEMDFDPEKVTTIVSNLLSNAIKFTPENGKISLKVSRTDNQLNIKVFDNGTGISPCLQEKIFERFYQVDDQDTRQVGGAGIGLSLTKELVLLLNGSISVTSNPGFETVFTVKLPMTATEKKSQKIPDFRQEQQQSFPEDAIENLTENTGDRKSKDLLLLIEDNPDVVSYIVSCYRDRFKIEVANNGKDGMLKALESIPDIIVSDIMMPEMDGFQLCNKLKNDYRTSHIPVVLLTAKADLPSRIRGLEEGADAFVVKPFNQHELLVRITKLLELRRRLCERYAEGVLPSETNACTSILREDQFMKKLTACIRQNLPDENFDVHALCTEMAMSKSQLYRKFKALTNMSAAKYIRKLRMQRARHLLLTTSMNITEISWEVGIKTLSTFSEIFKDEFGQSPTEYQGHFSGNLREN